MMSFRKSDGSVCISICILLVNAVCSNPAVAQNVPEIAGFAKIDERNFPEYYKVLKERPSIELIAAFLPVDEEGQPSMEIHEATGKQILLSRFPYTMTYPQFTVLKKQVDASSKDFDDKGKMLNLGGVYAKMLEFLPSGEIEDNSFFTGMLFEFPISETELAVQASVTMHVWQGGSVYRVEMQQFADSLDDWKKELQEIVETVRDGFVSVKSTSSIGSQ